VVEEYVDKYGKEDKGTPFRQQRRIYKWSFPTIMPRWGHRKTLHSKRNTTKKWGWL